MKNCVILTGAGISADSGLKTFRDTDGLWEGHHVEDVATPEAFNRNPQLVIDFYNQRRAQLQQVKPNPAHYALKDLEQYFNVQIITQNVDDLHERAGSSNILHLHGELNKLRSVKYESYVIDFNGEQSIFDMDPDGHPMRPHIVWFGENVPAIDEAVGLCEMADILVIIGTSLKVYPAAGLMNYAPIGTPIYLVDPNPANLSNVKSIASKAKDGVPNLVKELIELSK